MTSAKTPDSSNPVPFQQKLAELRADYLRRLQGQLAEMRALAAGLATSECKPGCVRDLHMLAHKLAGGAGTFGYHAVSQFARRLEELLRAELSGGASGDEAGGEGIASRVARALDDLDRLARQIVTGGMGQASDLLLRKAPVFEPLIHVVEDDPSLAQLIAARLGTSGYRVKVFDNAASVEGEAVPPQAIIMDIVLPEGIDAGLRAMASLRRKHAGLPVIVISVRDDAQARLAALRAGAVRYLSKPIDLERLIGILDGVTGLIPPEPYRVLLVDDDEDALQYNALVLGVTGMRTRCVPRPLDALSAARDMRPDVIVLDLRMPEASGLELAALLREDDALAQTPILFLSAETDLDMQLAALDLGGDEFLLKPVAPDYLVAAVRARAKRSRHNQRITEDLRRVLAEKDYSQFAIDQHAVVSVTDVAGNIIYANRKFEEISGYTLPELIGRNHRLLKSGKHPDSYYREMWETISGGRVWHGTVCNRRKDGGFYWVESTIVPFLDSNGLPYQYISVRTDITAIMEVEARLRAERDFSDAAINAIPGTFYVLDARGNLLRTNDGKSYITGYSREEVARMNALEFFAEADRARIAEAIQSGFETGRAHVEARLLTKAGETIPFLYQATRFEVDGVAVLIGTGTDISALKQTELDLIRAKEAAERASRAKSDFLSSMSHELRTPMNAILGFAQLLDMDRGLQPEHRDSVAEVLKAGHHLLILINEVLDLAKVEAGRVDLAPEAVACDELIGECARLVEIMARERGIALQVEARPWAVRADRTRLKQALVNLLSNAIKYNRPGGSVRFDLVEGGDGMARMRVRDSGPGIPLERQAELFQAFNRIGAERTEVEGAGIGLVITRRLIELMGGRIGMESIPGVGSTFWIELPRDELAATDWRVGARLAGHAGRCAVELAPSHGQQEHGEADEHRP